MNRKCLVEFILFKSLKLSMRPFAISLTRGYLKYAYATKWIISIFLFVISLRRNMHSKNTHIVQQNLFKQPSLSNIVRIVCIWSTTVFLPSSIEQTLELHMISCFLSSHCTVASSSFRFVMGIVAEINKKSPTAHKAYSYCQTRSTTTTTSKLCVLNQQSQKPTSLKWQNVYIFV